MLLFNVLSSVCAWALRALPLNTFGLLLAGGIGLLNVGFGRLAAWSLMQPPVPRDRGPACNEAPAAGEVGASRPGEIR